METLADGSTGTGRQHGGVKRAIPLTGMWLGMLALTAIWLTALAASGAGYPGFSAGRVGFWWVASMLFLAVTAAWFDAGGTASRVLAFRWPGVVAVGSWLGMTLLAVLPRFVALDRFPTVLDADEAAFMVHALEFRHGEMSNPFTTGYFSTPLLFMAAQGVTANVVGDGIAAYRLPSAILGAIAVLATWRLGIRIAGPLAGTLGAAILATMPLHLHFSRLALNNVTDATFLLLALLFGYRALEQHRALDAVATGFSLGIAAYGYYGGRALWLVVLVTLVALALARRVPLRSLLITMGWICAGTVAPAMPLIVAFWRNPAEISGHLTQVSPISAETFRDDPFSIGGLYLGNVLDAVVYPLWADAGGFFRHDRPLIGGAMAVLVLAGVATVAFDALRRRVGTVAIVIGVPYLLLVAGIALAIPIASQRYVSVTPLLALFGGIGLAAMTSGAGRLLPALRPPLPIALAILAVIVLSVANLRWVASEDRQLDTYGDLRTTMMWDLGWRLREGDGSVTRLMIVGSPYLYAYGFPNLTFLAPDIVQEDVPGHFVAGGGAPPLPPDAIMVLVPERAGERCVIEEAYPGVTVGEVYARNGSLLYIVFFRDTAHGFTMQDSAAETSVEAVTGSPCVPGDLS
jgi:4-amino-4-deoxy-L-arabinose transferase-like glycosyltransferase